MFAVLAGGAIQHHFAAILRASSFVSSFAADRRPGFLEINIRKLLAVAVLHNEGRANIFN
jgi:hypothetical protein